MKKLIILLLAFMAIFAVNVKAQLKYGPRASVALTSLGGGNSSIGFQIGLFLNAELKDRMGIQPEILFSLKNGSDTYNSLNASGQQVEYKTSYSFTYLDIPIYGYVPISKHITFLFGPQLGIINKATKKTTGPGLTSSEQERKDVSGTDASVGIAGGIDFELNSPIKFGVRFSTTGGETFKGKSTFVGVTMAYYMDW